MTIAAQFLRQLETGGIDAEGAERFLAENIVLFSPEEVLQVRAWIARLEAERALQRRKAQLRDLIPAGWLRDYMVLADISEAPESFHFFSAASILSCVIGRRMFYPLGLTRLFAPISVFLMSPAGKTTRSTAALAAARILQSSGATVLRGKFTPEGLIRFIGKEQKLLIFNDEAAQLFSRRDYMADMAVTMCAVLDGGNQDVTLSKQEIRIPDCSVNCLLTCAVDWLPTMPKSAIGGGLMSRVLLVHEEKKSKLLSRPNDLDGFSWERVLALQTELAGQLEALEESLPDGRRLVFLPDAGRRYDAFYKDNARLLEEADDKLSVYLSRKPAQVIKLIMTLIASSGASLEVTEEQVEIALAILATIEGGIEGVYKEAALEKEAGDQSRVIKLLTKAGGKMDRSVLINKTGWNKRHLDEVLSSLSDAGRVSRGLLRQGTNARKLVTYYEILTEE